MARRGFFSGTGWESRRIRLWDRSLFVTGIRIEAACVFSPDLDFGADTNSIEISTLVALRDRREVRANSILGFVAGSSTEPDLNPLRIQHAASLAVDAIPSEVPFGSRPEKRQVIGTRLSLEPS